MASAKTRRAAAVLRDRARTNRAATRERRAALIAAHRIRKAPRSLVTHLIATGADRETVQGAANSLRRQARKTGITGRAVRLRRTQFGESRFPVVAKRYTRAEVAQIAADWKPRKPEYKALRPLLLAA
ncbi:hypothetical protein QR97_01790 [Streptomyces sp. PBH53]|uniref:hypothetical protein n=1 Tax=Streptomyces sp. PBH53 TaxID=1577075 RepID=UPI000655B219|nr:hypothetical protein [Streptomyces sp. PBH53]AKN68704.1 hypothetical protein QR97_01790 [Streptomyces sp. PBH53]